MAADKSCGSGEKDFHLPRPKLCPAQPRIDGAVDTPHELIGQRKSSPAGTAGIAHDRVGVRSYFEPSLGDWKHYAVLDRSLVQVCIPGHFQVAPSGTGSCS